MLTSEAPSPQRKRVHAAILEGMTRGRDVSQRCPESPAEFSDWIKAVTTFSLAFSQIRPGKLATILGCTFLPMPARSLIVEKE